MAIFCRFGVGAGLVQVVVGLMLVLGQPAVGEASSNTSYKNKKRGMVVSSKAKRVVRLAARTVSPRNAATVMRAVSRPRGAGKGASLPVAVAAFSRPVVVGEAGAQPMQGAAPANKKPLPQRMYAVEGNSFYFNGRKYRVDGVPDASAGQEFNKQRLQQLLDAGEVSIEPRAIDEAGVTTALIRIAGRDVADRLK